MSSISIYVRSIYKFLILPIMPQLIEHLCSCSCSECVCCACLRLLVRSFPPPLRVLYYVLGPPPHLELSQGSREAPLLGDSYESKQSEAGAKYAKGDRLLEDSRRDSRGPGQARRPAWFIVSKLIWIITKYFRLSCRY